MVYSSISNMFQQLLDTFFVLLFLVLFITQSLLQYAFYSLLVILVCMNPYITLYYGSFSLECDPMFKKALISTPVTQLHTHLSMTSQRVENHILLALFHVDLEKLGNFTNRNENMALMNAICDMNPFVIPTTYFMEHFHFIFGLIVAIS